MMSIQTMLDLKTLPLPKTGCRAHYEGSIDKQGYNADWDWFLYEDDNKEWVLFEHLGPGCICNFVQHRYPCCDEPEFRFYIDGEKEPRFTIKHSQFGEKYPLQEPAASRYIGPYDNGRGPIRVVRSFVPMAYQKSCKITSTIKLQGNDRTKNEGGWGHVIYHAYENDSKVTSFLPGENNDYQKLTALWKQAGSCIHSLRFPQYKKHTGLLLKPGETYTLCDLETPGTIAGIRFLTDPYTPAQLSDLQITAFWDGHKAPDVDANFGCFFSNELGIHSVRYLLSGMDTLGNYYHFYPMPFEKSCTLTIKNKGSQPVSIPFAEVLFTQEWNDYYRENGFLYYRTTPYYSRKHTPGADSILAEVSGSGHIVSSVITAFGQTPDSRADCEGDVRIHLDGIRTPQIESDGSESYSCYGWGFETPQEYNPASGYDGHEHKCWSMHRALMGDWYPFLSGFRFAIESGGCNDLYLEHSGMIFYYGTDRILLEKIGEIDFSDSRSLETMQYRCADPLNIESLTSYFEGDDDHIPLTFCGHYAKGSRQFVIEVPEKANAIFLRRVSDQETGRQKALVYVDHQLVETGPWYFSDSNPYKRFLEDEFIIPGKYFEKKSQITVEIIPQPAGSTCSFNEFGYQIFARF